MREFLPNEERHSFIPKVYGWDSPCPCALSQTDRLWDMDHTLQPLTLTYKCVNFMCLRCSSPS